MKLIINLLIVSLCVLNIECYRSRKLNWDYTIFTQQWPITTCIGYMSLDKDNTCNLYNNITSWTVHGLWPTMDGAMHPCSCNKSWHFDMSKINDLEPYLIKYWGNMYGGKSVSSLWKHEWEKHGTCAAELDLMNTEHKYFQKGLELAIKYDLVAVLARHNIVPDDQRTYSIDVIYQALKNSLGTNPKIDCIYDLERKRHYVSQIKLCQNVNFELVDCDKLKHFNDSGYFFSPQSSCPKENITYPASIESGGVTWIYPSHLPGKQLEVWEKSRSICNTWACYALFTVYSLMWLTI